MTKTTLIENEDGHLQYECIGGVYFFHLSLQKWSLSKYKEYTAFFENVMLGLSDSGVNRVFTIIPDGDAKLLKFQRMFGFEIVQESDGNILLSRKTRL